MHYAVKFSLHLKVSQILNTNISSSMNPSTPRSPLQLTAHLVVTPFLRIQVDAFLLLSDHKLTTSQQQISSALGFSFPPNCASIFWHGRGIRCLVMSHEYSRPREQCFHREREILGSKFVNWRNPYILLSQREGLF